MAKLSQGPFIRKGRMSLSQQIVYSFGKLPFVVCQQMLQEEGISVMMGCDYVSLLLIQLFPRSLQAGDASRGAHPGHRHC